MQEVAVLINDMAPDKGPSVQDAIEKVVNTRMSAQRYH